MTELIRTRGGASSSTFQKAESFPTPRASLLDTLSTRELPRGRRLVGRDLQKFIIKDRFSESNSIRSNTQP